MAMIEARKPTIADMVHISAHMRAMDRRECWELYEAAPRKAVLQSVQMSTWCASVISRGELIAIVGVAREHLLSSIGQPWMLAVEGIEEHQRAFAILTGPIIARMHVEYPRLENVVHTENETSIGWLRRAGFEFGEPEPFGRRGAQALRFWKASDVVRDCSSGVQRPLGIRAI